MKRYSVSTGSEISRLGGFLCSGWVVPPAVVLFAFVFTVQPSIAADPLAPAKGPVVLTVGGNIQNTNLGDTAVFDREMLAKIGLKSLTTSTSWTEGKVKFEGVGAADLMRVVGAKGQKVVATALNDYKIEIPISDFEKYGVLLALKMDGKELTRRDKGPVWVVYPRDGHKELQNQKADARWIWQLVRLSVE